MYFPLGPPLLPDNKKYKIRGVSEGSAKKVPSKVVTASWCGRHPSAHTSSATVRNVH